jgi:hypothetical protein
LQWAYELIGANPASAPFFDARRPPIKNRCPSTNRLGGGALVHCPSGPHGNPICSASVNGPLFVFDFEFEGCLDLVETVQYIAGVLSFGIDGRTFRALKDRRGVPKAFASFGSESFH